MDILTRAARSTHTRTIFVTRLPYNEWKDRVAELRASLDASPDDLQVANAYWESISGQFGYDVRDGKRVIDTFELCALRTEDGLAQLIAAFRKLADELGELPRDSLFTPPLENLLRMVARQQDHTLCKDAAWILECVESNVE